MLDSIVHFSIKNKFVVLLGALALAVWGGWAFTRLPIDAIPDITNNQAQVLTVCPTLATQEVEQFVTAPIENAVRSIPGVTELRSISRFGLSVVTVVFDEKTSPFLARQLLNEKLGEAKSLIPPAFGSPELAPISTGLGEILHYRVEAAPGFEKKFTPLELRTIQDWTVKRQLAGIPGVVEINSFGGFLKQWEIALDPARLRSAGVSIPEILTAVEAANQNTGGAYIEKNSDAYFIRTEGLAKNEDDLREILVKTRGGLPLKIGDLAQVRIGHAPRLGAVSHNAEGEIVLGIVMMLKGANASEVISRVKKRMAEIAPALPEGVRLVPFLDRQKLVDRTIATVRDNLIEGALIVIFVLALLLGNWRAGLLIASVIPLSMLFAVGCMEFFGVSANLMSLGAIDFGLIVDGAVIVVEAALHFLAKRQPHKNDGSKAEIEAAVRMAASQVMRSSVFGVLIILLVYLPILALTGVEGKMFRPMAQTVSFALVGALILSLTYVPAMAAAFLKMKDEAHDRTFADRLIGFLQKTYRPVLRKALARPSLVLGSAAAFFGLSLWLFSRMGGEFIPVLDEGDMMMHGFCRPGTSLTQTLESHRLAQKVILENFPDEVDEVISKIGSAEIPTDPMAPETADNVILLKDKKGWKKAADKNALVALISEKVRAAVPGMAFEFTQPIKMRFDEMMTGVRSDIAVKIFGDNLDSLARAARRAERILAQIPGLEDLKTEQTEGLPQISIRFDFPKIARLGLRVADLNLAVRAAFAGEPAGVIFEDERRFDLVVRLDTANRRDLSDVQKLPVALPDGSLISLENVAKIGFLPGAAQISRDDGRRRIVVSANVRGRDVETAIADAQQILGEKLRLPEGYFLRFGGQFENLEAAKKRLSIAVPAALLLIFLLLFFAFSSLRDALLIFTAIPLSAIGGVLALWLRGMDFSISAGVGFIALFGVAVLNGIVLIASFRQLEKEGATDRLELIMHGSLVRLRPVLTTAAVAALGFLPMAISAGAGAEVQRPLATVVIGGLVSATVLTLVALPVLFFVFGKKQKLEPTDISS